MADFLEFPQADADRMFTELGELRVELDDDPLTFGPKRLNSKTAQVRRMLDRCETLFLDVSRQLQGVRRALRVATTDLDLAKKNLFANDPETRAGRSVSDREAIAAGKLNKEIMAVHDMNLASEDLDAVLVVIKAKRADLKDTEGRLRDQIRLCSEEIGLGGRWGSRVPNAPDIRGRAAFKTATGSDVDDVTTLIDGLDGEIALSRDAGEWDDPVIPDPAPPPQPEDVPLPMPPVNMATALAEAIVFANASAIPDVIPAVNVPAMPIDEPTEEIHLEGTPSESKDLETTMGITIGGGDDVDVFLESVSVTSDVIKPDIRKSVADIDMDSILGMFETP